MHSGYNIFKALLLILLFSCSDHVKENKETVTQPGSASKIKPPSGFTDTLNISSPAAVFYYPDSSQLQKIRSEADTGAFDADMHEYEFLFKTAHSALKKDFPAIKIIEAKKVRYLLFLPAGDKDSCIDLDKNYEPYGLYLFNGKQLPHKADIANIDSELGFIFREK
jgi:hypothetical protein